MLSFGTNGLSSYWDVNLKQAKRHKQAKEVVKYWETNQRKGKAHEQYPLMLITLKYFPRMCKRLPHLSHHMLHAGGGGDSNSTRQSRKWALLKLFWRAALDSGLLGCSCECTHFLQWISQKKALFLLGLSIFLISLVEVLFTHMLRLRSTQNTKRLFFPNFSSSLGSHWSPLFNIIICN